MGSEMCIRDRFTPSNWNIFQTITVIGVDDLIIDGDILSPISIQVDSIQSDPLYQNLPTRLISISNLDNDSDQDGDGIFDAVDNCIQTPNVNQEDLDGDGIGDACDDDIDADGVANPDELVDSTDPYDPCSFLFQSISLPVSEVRDCDLDGISDEIDLDDDNDGILDLNERFEDIDLDGIPNTLDLDSDDDGCFDAIEASFTDGDSDGVLGEGVVSVDVNGQVIGQGGYTLPLDIDSNGQPEYKELGQLIVLQTELEPTTEYDSSSISLSVGVSGNGVSFQWQINNGFDCFKFQANKTVTARSPRAALSPSTSTP